MPKMFDGRKFRDEILDDITASILKYEQKPQLAVIWVGDDFASDKYIQVKRAAALRCGIGFEVFHFENTVEEEVLRDKILALNNDGTVTGILIQMPLPEHIDYKMIINSVLSEKDVDGLRFCSDFNCVFRAPVTLAILRAIEESGIKLSESKTAIIGQGFLVGAPITKILRPLVGEIRIVDKNAQYLAIFTSDADLIISATGQGNIIKSDMIKKGVVLIDAGTTEMNGQLSGDIDPAGYKKASFYTPVPGGIGPSTVAMLFKNVLEAFKLQQNEEI